MRIEKAINRLSWRLRQDKDGKFYNFRPTAEDVESLNRIIDWINDAREQAINNNTGFAKLYIMTFSFFLDRYGTKKEDGTLIPASVFSDIPQMTLNKQLDQPLEYFYRKFTERLNDNEAYEVLEEIEAGNLTTGEIAADPEGPEMKAITGKAWSQDKVTEHLQTMIAEALINYKI